MLALNVRMLVHCGGKRISTQELELQDGKVSFAAFAVTAVGKCEVTLTSSKTKKKTINFTVEAKVTIQLPPTTQPPSPPTQPPSPSTPNPPQPNKPTAPQPTDKVPLPKLNASLTIGKPFSIDSKVARKVQPNSLCENTIMLIYYDGSRVMEVLTAGINVPAVNGKIDGLTFISLKSPPSIAYCGKGSPTKSITMSIMPGYPQGVSANVALPSSSPSLANPVFSDSSGKIKLAWGTATGFDKGADIFFSNADTGNEFVKHTGTVNWRNNSSVTATLNHSTPVRALIRVKLSAGVHWLYFK